MAELVDALHSGCSIRKDVQVRVLFRALNIYEFDLSFDIQNAYNKAINLAKTHYENFPVLSLFIPSDLIKHVAIIYYFARTADDIADEGNLSDSVRLQQLTDIQNNIRNLSQNIIADEYYAALLNTYETTGILPDNLYFLIEAFKQDTQKKRYKDFNELLAYCKNSANPVGRMMLELFNCNSEYTYEVSDKICTALQLANFLQDIAQDFKRDRVYLPQNELEYFGITEDDIANAQIDIRFVRLMKMNIYRAKKMLWDGFKLLEHLPFRLRIQIFFTIKGGLAILRKIEYNKFDIYSKRIKLNKLDILKQLLTYERRRKTNSKTK